MSGSSAVWLGKNCLVGLVHVAKCKQKLPTTFLPLEFREKRSYSAITSESVGWISFLEFSNKGIVFAGSWLAATRPWLKCLLPSRLPVRIRWIPLVFLRVLDELRSEGITIGEAF
jgi:hypothetical protein